MFLYFAVDDQQGCTEKEVDFISKMQAASADGIEDDVNKDLRECIANTSEVRSKQLERLENMKEGRMKPK